MPDREVTTIKELIFYQYAKLIARSAFKVPDGKQVKQQHFGFIKKTFRALRDGEKEWSQITREDRQFVQSEKCCIYCGSETDLEWEHIVPRSLKIKPECAMCDRVQGIHNQVWACRGCNSAKGTMGIYEFFKIKQPENPKFYDFIPPLLEKKYLKTIFNCHACAGTLGESDLDRDGKISVLDVDQVLHRT